MKKIFTLLLFFVLAGSSVMAQTEKTFEVLPVFSAQSVQANRVWVGTFQLVWNDFMNEIVKSPIKFVGGTPSIVKQLNKQSFKAEELSESSYYKTYGAVSTELKETIEKAIKEKFNETSDILDGIDWTPASNKYIVYAMLKKDFKFLTAFDKLKPAKFGHSFNKVEYFGIDKNSDSALDNAVKVLFYNSSKDFAVAIYTQGNDVLYLYRTNDNKTFDKLYSEMFSKAENYQGSVDFNKDDEFKVPNINLYKEKSFSEFSGKQIKGTDIFIDDAIETIDFKMNNEGIKLKSEAALITKMSFRPVEEKVKPRKFYFNDTFVLFLQETDKEKPYFALRVQDVSLINKTGR